MAHLYGKVQNNGGEVTRCGTKKTGMKTTCASWAGAVQCTAYVDSEGVDYVLVQKILWEGAGVCRILYDGPIGEEPNCDHPRHRNPGLTTPCPECEKREAG